jgi:hypothetical protein
MALSNATLKHGSRADQSRDPVKMYDHLCKVEAQNKLLNLDLVLNLNDLSAPEIPEPRTEDNLATSWHDETDMVDEDQIDPEVPEVLSDDPMWTYTSLRAELGLPELSKRGRHSFPLDPEDFEVDEDILAANGMHFETIR